MNAKKIYAAGVAVAAAVAAVAVGAGGASAGPAATSLNPGSFAHPVANPYFPLTPGLVLHYRGLEGTQKFRETLTVTHRTKTIEGVKATVLHDVLRRADGTLAEATHDWYADDNSGNVWYLGEATATYKPSGQVASREGSWQAGVGGAVAGVIMPADPKPTDAYRQELWRGHAEDQAWIVQSNTTVRVPQGVHRHVVRSYEWSRLEKANVSLKFYARGIGILREGDVAGGDEHFWLVRVTRP